MTTLVRLARPLFLRESRYSSTLRVLLPELTQWKHNYLTIFAPYEILRCAGASLEEQTDDNRFCAC